MALGSTGNIAGYWQNRKFHFEYPLTDVKLLNSLMHDANSLKIFALQGSETSNSG